MNTIKRVLIGCLLLFAMPKLIYAQNIVVPNSLANVEGDGNNGFPFNLSNFSIPSQRYQQD